MPIAKKLFVSLFATFVISSACLFSASWALPFVISVDRIEVLPQKDQIPSTVFSVRNTSTEPVRVRVSTVNWNMNERGSASFIEKPIPFGLSGMLRFNPREFVLPVGSTQVIRLAGIIPKDSPDGEYRCFLIFEDTKTKEQKLSGTDKGVSASLEVHERRALPVYLMKGQVQSNTVLDAFDVKPLENGVKQISVLLNNTGNRHGRLKGSLSLYRQAGGQYELVQSSPLNGGGDIVILPGTRIEVPYRFNTQQDSVKYGPGHYKAEVNLLSRENPDSQPVVKTVEFDI